VYLIGQGGLNTLVDFRYTRLFRAQRGHAGGGRNRTGRSGDDLYIKAPVGTLARDGATGELIGDITREGETLLVARGGKGGFGNAHFKSATNRAPRRISRGTPGERRELGLELQVLADVGLLGLPNAGKSTFLRAVSEARPKVADYPFTTLYPHLGVVRVEPHRSFVIADIPGLIEGAASGAGLGVRFLKHLVRTRILLHLVDAGPLVWGGDVADSVRAVGAELEAFSSELAARERWLVLNKMDLVPEDERDWRLRALVRAVEWKGPVFRISAISGEGCQGLSRALMRRLEELRRVASEDAQRKRQ